MLRLVLLITFLGTVSASADTYGFQTPSGNIYCNGVLQSRDIVCTIVDLDAPPAQADPGTCSANWGHHVMLPGSGPASLICGDAPQKSTDMDVAKFGVSANFGGITCMSESTGLTCRNQSGHGFTLSQGKQTLF